VGPAWIRFLGGGSTCKKAESAKIGIKKKSVGSISVRIKAPFFNGGTRCSKASGSPEGEAKSGNSGPQVTHARQNIDQNQDRLHHDDEEGHFGAVLQKSSKGKGETIRKANLLDGLSSNRKRGIAKNAVITPLTKGGGKGHRVLNPCAQKKARKKKRGKVEKKKREASYRKRQERPAG